MKKSLRLALAACLSLFVSLGAAQDLAGTWEGPWYRGMTSGTMVLDINPAGEGTVQFVNLDNFGEQVVTLQRVSVDGARFDFSASGEGAGVFVATTRLIKAGQILKGKGEYEGFPIKFELTRH